MGSELLIDNDINSFGEGPKVNFKKIPDQYRKLIGKHIKIIAGNWKGYQGILVSVLDKRARIELHSKNKIISVDVNCIQDSQACANNNINNVSNSFNQSVFDTPRNNPGLKTPTYYPQSPSFNPTSPKWNPAATRKIIFYFFIFF